jgi:hypothetical protein
MRLIDRMCPAHVEACRVRWVAVGDCPLCKQQSQGLPEPAILPDLTRNGPDRVNAVHEAGHAVVALVLGIPVTFVEIWRDGERGEGPNGGNTQFEDGWDALWLDKFTMLWAGQEATDRWLTELGLGTDGNRLDMRFVARHDAAKFDTAIAENGLGFEFDAGVVKARELVDAKWEQIVTPATAQPLVEPRPHVPPSGRSPKRLPPGSRMAETTASASRLADKR